MKVLIIKFSPIEAITSSMFRTIAVAKGLKNQGHDIYFLTIPMMQVQTLSDKEDIIKDFHIVRTKSNQLYKKVISGTTEHKNFKLKCVNFLRFVWHKFHIYNNTFSIAKNININLLPIKEFDLLISSSDPKTSHIAAMELIKQGLKYKKWIQYWGDPMTIDITRQDLYPDFILKEEEKKILKGADAVIYVSPFTLMSQKKLFPNFADKMYFLPVPYMESTSYEETNNSVFTVGYYGNYDSNIRNLKPFYQALQKLGDLIHGDIVGDSDLLLKSTPNIQILPKGIVTELEKKADLIVCVLNKSGTQIPGKLYHAAATNKKILVILDGSHKDKMKTYLEKFHRFLLCDNKAESIYDAILKAREDNHQYNAVSFLECDKIAKKFIDIAMKKDRIGSLENEGK